LFRSINDARYIQSLCRDRNTCSGAVTTGEDLIYERHRLASGSDFHKCTYYSTNHITQKAIGRDMKNHAVVAFLPFRTGDIADIGKQLRIGFAKAADILLSQRWPRSLVHFGQTRPISHQPREVY